MATSGRTRLAVFATGMIATLSVGVGLDGWPDTVLRQGALMVGAVLNGALALTAAERFQPWVERLHRHWSSWRRRAVEVVVGSAAWLLVAALVLVLGAVVPGTVDAIRAGAASGCERPVELRVLTSPESVEPFQQVADAYVRDTAQANDDCPTVSTHVFAAPFEGVGGARDSLRNGWPDSALRQWPRPDVWFADSTLDVNAVGEGQLVTIAERGEAAWTPMVLAVPRDHENALGSGDMTWADLFAWTAGTEDVSLLRPRPRSSAAGTAATTVLYARAGVGGGTGDAATVERRVDSPLSEGDLLCSRYTAEDSAAIIVSEQALVAYNQGRLGGCPDVAEPDFAEQLVAFYPTDTVHLTREFVRLDWGDAAGPQDEAAAEFGEWLAGEAGQQELLAARLRPPDLIPGDPISEEWGANETGDPGDPLDRDEVAAALGRYAEARQSGWLLALLDTSGSMTQQVDSERNRFDRATEAVLAALDLMIERDRFGLYSFPADGRDATAERVPLASAGGDPARLSEETSAALDALSEHVEGATPLFDAIDESLQVLVDEGADADSNAAVVVITDGEDTGSQVTEDDLVERVSQDGSPRVFVIAVGEATCQAGLDQVTRASGGQCLLATFEALDRVLDEVARGLWRGGE